MRRCRRWRSSRRFTDADCPASCARADRNWPAHWSGAGLVDELCLTTSPLLTAALLPMLPGVASERRLRLSQLLVDESDALYARWSVPVRPATG